MVEYLGPNNFLGLWAFKYYIAIFIVGKLQFDFFFIFARWWREWRHTKNSKKIIIYILYMYSQISSSRQRGCYWVDLIHARYKVCSGFIDYCSTTTVHTIVQIRIGGQYNIIIVMHTVQARESCTSTVSWITWRWINRFLQVHSKGKHFLWYCVYLYLHTCFVTMDLFVTTNGMKHYWQCMAFGPKWKFWPSLFL